MRIIDADALRERLTEQWQELRSGEMDRPDIGDETEWAQILLAEAPVLRCDGCKYLEVSDGPCLHPDMMTYSPTDEGYNFNPPANFSCSLWEAKDD